LFKFLFSPEQRALVEAECAKALADAQTVDPEPALEATKSVLQVTLEDGGVKAEIVPFDPIKQAGPTLEETNRDSTPEPEAAIQSEYRKHHAPAREVGKRNETDLAPKEGEPKWIN